MRCPQPDPAPSVSFSELGLSAPMLRTLDEVGYTDPTPIQGADRCRLRSREEI